jgi:hypothetical protein
MVISAQSLSVCLFKVTRALLGALHGGQGSSPYLSLLETGMDLKNTFFRGKELTEGERTSQKPAMRTSNSLLNIIAPGFALICPFAITLILLYYLRRPGTLVPLRLLGILLYVPYMTVLAALREDVSTAWQRTYPR